MKYAENRNLDKACREAIRQVRDKQYMTRLQDDGMETIHIYGIACYLKSAEYSMRNMKNNPEDIWR